MTTSGASRSLAATVGTNIRAARRAADLTQNELAALVGVDLMMVSRWERGVHRPNDENLCALATALGRDVSWFYTEAVA